MPEYLAPGVFVEEVSYRAKSIEGVSTTTTGFVGPTRYGPTEDASDVITSLVEFERTYGDRQQLAFATGAAPATTALHHNYMWHAVRSFFEQGGKRLYVNRVFRALATDDDGRAGTVLRTGAAVFPQLRIRARFPGAAGKRRVRLSLSMGANVLAPEPQQPGGGTPGTTVRGLGDRDVVLVRDRKEAPAVSTEGFYVAELETDAATGRRRWKFQGPLGATAAPIRLEELRFDIDPAKTDEVRVVTARLVAEATEEDGLEQVWDGLPLDPRHEIAGRRDSLFARFARTPDNAEEAKTLPIIVDLVEESPPPTTPPPPRTGLSVLDLLFGVETGLEAGLKTAAPEDDRTIARFLDGGNDGARPGADEYLGTARLDSPVKTGLMALEDMEDISIVAAPGSTAGYRNGYQRDAMSIANHLIGHAERMRYRIAVLDSGDRQTIREVRQMRAQLDSKHAAFYYPWVRVLDPVTRMEIPLPPSGFVAGIYARNDVNRAVYKAPANEVVTGALGFEISLNKAQQEVLNPEGINCFRFFEGRGNRLWGARTISSDPEWKYVNLRRYFAYLEHSIDRGTQWAVFEPNGELLWANVRRTISDFLFNEFAMGALLGERPENAFFVKCDRSTMTQNDLDNGRLVCLIGVAALRPAEFVIFRIGQWTADAKR